MRCQLPGAFILFAALWVNASCATAPHVDWEKASDCFARIQSGGQEKIIADAKHLIRQERWNADAHACLAMAYYSSGNIPFALKSLKEAEETLPQETIDAIHNAIWTYQPELLAEKEYKDFSVLSGGDCILKNVTALDGTGTLILGYFFNPETKKTIRHVRARKCIAQEQQQCAEIDKVCPLCTLKELEAIITIKDYKVIAVKKFTGKHPIERNLRYIEKILELERQ